MKNAMRKLLVLLLCLCICLSLSPAAFAKIGTETPVSGTAVWDNTNDMSETLGKKPEADSIYRIYEFETSESDITASGTCGDNLSWKLFNNGELEIEGTGDMTAYNEAAAPWYDSRLMITSLNIKYGVTSIGSYAFFGCSELKTLSIPQSITRIGSNAFKNCSKLADVTIPDSVTDIGYAAFAYCGSLKNIIIPVGITSIGNSVFAYCTGLSSITIPEGVTRIGAGIFLGCTSLTSVTIPDSLTSISDYAFYECISLASIVIPGSVSSIGRYAFYLCSSLVSVTIPESVVYIDVSAFDSCSGLTQLIISEGVTRIDKWAFSRCDSLTAVTIPSSVTSIDNYAFKACSALTDVYYNGTAEQWDDITVGTDNEPLTDATIHFNHSDTVTIRFDPNGGSGVMDDQEVPAGETVALSLNQFTASAGMTFVGWNTMADGSGTVYKDGAKITPIDDITLYAQWMEDACTVTFDKNNDLVTGEVYTQSILKGIATALMANQFIPPEGLIFDGWNTKRDGSGTAFKDQANVKVSKDITLYAQWADDSTCTVTFDKNHELATGETYTQTLPKNTATRLRANEYTPPEGMAFKSWNTKPDGSGIAFKDQANVRVSRNITLYAQWVNVCTVTFDKNAEDATGSMEPQIVEPNVDTLLNANVFQRVNYSFRGWSSSPDGTGDKYADQGVVNTGEDLTLYAVWKQIAFAITYDRNGGGGSQMAQQNVSIGNTATIRECAYTAKPGEIFVCWEDTADGTRYEPGQKIIPDSDLALRAVWADELIISYYPGEGSGTYNEGEAPKGFEAGVKTAAEAKFTAPAGAAFAYWQDEDGNKYYEGQQYIFNKDMRLTAIWAAACVITYNKNASDATGTMATQTVPSGVEVTLHENKFTRSEYIFKYWTKTKSDPYPNMRASEVNSADVYRDGTSFTVTQDTTLYAQWYKTAISSNAVRMSGELTGLDDFAVWGETLTAAVNDPVLKSGFTYAWQVDGSSVKEGSDNTYLVKKEDYGKPIVCVVSHPQTSNEVESNTKIVGTYAETDDLMIINNGDSSYPYSKYAYVYGVVPGTTFYKDGGAYTVPESAADGVMEIGVPGTYSFGYATCYIENWFTVGYEYSFSAGSGTITMKNGITTLTRSTKTSDIVHFVNNIWLVRDGSATDLNIMMKPSSGTYVQWSLNGGVTNSSSAEVFRRLGTIDQPMLFNIVFNKSSSSPQTEPDCVLPASLTVIGEEAFSGSAFRYVKLSEGTTGIDGRAFADCANLALIYIPEATTDIADDAFEGVMDLTILGPVGSCAQTYAQQKGFTYIPTP